MEERLEKIKHSIGIIVDEVAELEKDLNKEIAVVEEEKEWKPKYEEEYYYIDLDCMTIDFAIWYNDSCDIAHLKHKVVFKTRQEAEEYLDYLQAKEKAMNEFSQEEWEENCKDKCFIYYSYEEKNLIIDFNWKHKIYNTPYFRSEEDAQEFIGKYEKQIKRDMSICEN